MPALDHVVSQLSCRWRESEAGVVVLELGTLPVLRHSPGQPFASVGRGRPAIRMRNGNFDIADDPADVRLLRHASLEAGVVRLAADRASAPALEIAIVDSAHADAVLTVRSLQPGFDRVWLSFCGEFDENIWGGGEQMSYLRLNGRRFPMWTSEPGVGRDKSDPFTQHMDETAMAGGDYWTTNYPQPTFLSSRGYALHLSADSYSVLDFTNESAPQIEVWQSSFAIELFAGATPLELVSRLSDRFGRQPELPDWAIGGAIVGLKDGERSFQRLDAMLDAGVIVGGLWCEDWAGVRETSFGRRLRWDWQWNPARYPDLPKRIAALKSRGIRFLAYANPYLAVDGMLFQEAAANAYLAKRQDEDAPYLVDFGEFLAGIVDFTSDEARDWFAERILGRELLDIGIDGWMADFGEYLPVDLRLADGSDPMLAHNRWPVLWAAVNKSALQSRGRDGDAIFFMRAGYSGVQAYCPLLWAGDQCVDFSRHDGINTVITAAVSSGLVGNAYSHSDCGGYTSLHGKVRSAELLARWCELAAFAPVMRTHEGNRPDDNLQLDSNSDLLAIFARWSRVHAALAPYVRSLCKEATETGVPVQRAMFLHYPNDAEVSAIQDQFLYGADMLIAPVVEESARSRKVYIPADGPWVHAWTGETAAAGWQNVPAELGEPPVFYRGDALFADLFKSLRDIRDAGA